jgi:hypothetical protein
MKPIDWQIFEDEKPSEEGVAYLYAHRYGGWSKAYWVNGEFRDSLMNPHRSFVDPQFWAKVEMP